MELNRAAPNRVQIVSRVATAANNAPESKTRGIFQNNEQVGIRKVTTYSFP